MLELEPGSPADVDLRAARSRRAAGRRRRQLTGRRRRRRRVYRLLLAVLGATASSLAVVTGPEGAADSFRPPGIARSSLVCPVPSRLRPAFLAAARRTHLELGLLAAVAQVESRFDQGARSQAGAVGLLQLLPATAAGLALDPLRSRTNVLAGALYLRQLLARYGSPDLALAAYNAGPAAVDRAGAPPSPETASYVANVRAWWRALRGCT